MIAVDTSTVSAFLSGESGADVESFVSAVASGAIVLPPVVLTELLSEPQLSQALRKNLPDIETIEILDGYWQRAGESRRVLKSKGLRAKIADSLIAQSCIDRDVALITRDSDFHHFAKHCGLKLA